MSNLYHEQKKWAEGNYRTAIHEFAKIKTVSANIVLDNITKAIKTISANIKTPNEIEGLHGESISIEINEVEFYSIPFLIKEMRKMGWFPTGMSNGLFHLKYTKNNLLFFTKTSDIIEFTFQKYYEDLYDDKTQVFFYHVTPVKYLTRIIQKGLTPQSHSKKANHPKRIYLTTDQSSAEKLVANLRQYEPDSSEFDEYALLKIDTSKVPELELYNDSVYQNGVYTTQPIPPSAIQVVKRIPSARSI